jgi:hypothetical protein
LDAASSCAEEDEGSDDAQESDGAMKAALTESQNQPSKQADQTASAPQRSGS